MIAVFVHTQKSTATFARVWSHEVTSFIEHFVIGLKPDVMIAMLCGFE